MVAASTPSIRSEILSALVPPLEGRACSGFLSFSGLWTALGEVGKSFACTSARNDVSRDFAAANSLLVCGSVAYFTTTALNRCRSPELIERTASQNNPDDIRVASIGEA